MSKMREAMISQPDELARLLADDGRAEAAASRLAGRRVLLIGIGTSWHAAQHGAWFLRAGGVEAEALHAADVAPYGRAIDPADGVIVLSHTGATGYSKTMLERARAAGAEVLHISAHWQRRRHRNRHGRGVLRLHRQPHRRDARARPDRHPPRRAARPARRHTRAVAAVLDLAGPLIDVPQRLVELIGAGPNGWTAQEGALKIREASYVAAEGLSAEQFFHGPSVALDQQDTLVVLDGGGPMADRTEAIAAAVEVTGAKVARFSQRELGETLSVFPLTVIVQRIALELSEARGVSPDRFRYEQDNRREAAFEAARLLVGNQSLYRLGSTPAR